VARTRSHEGGTFGEFAPLRGEAPVKVGTRGREAGEVGKKKNSVTPPELRFEKTDGSRTGV